MKTIKQLSQAIEEKHVQIARVEEDLARAVSVAELSSAGEYELGELQRRRTEILGAAFIAKVDPDTSQVDREIEVREETIRASRQHAEAATAAQGALQAQLSTLREDAGALDQQRRLLMLAELQEGYKAGQKRYVDVVDTLGQVLRSMAALERGIAYLESGDPKNAATSPTAKVYGALQSRGLAVPPGYADPKYPHLTLPGDVVPPNWLDMPFDKFGSEETEKLSKDLAELGFK
jgi:hypothetical protein